MNQYFSLSKVKTASSKFCGVKTMHEIASLLNKDLFYLQTLALQPHYNLFSVPKQNGSARWIEDPEPRLKAILHTINYYLECVYHLMRSRAAYGFMIHVKNDNDARNILTNAQHHLGKPYLLKIDLADFFHQVKTEHLLAIFSSPPFHFNSEAATLLANLCTHEGRLPMGSPCSPTLSNFATLQLDQQLEQYCASVTVIYTRFVDDMSFSSLLPITEDQLLALRNILDSCHFVINERKVKMYEPGEERIITGLKLSDNIMLTDDFIDSLHNELYNFQSLMFTQKRFGHLMNAGAMKNYEKKVAGSIHFASFIMGEDNPQVIEWQKQFETAKDPPLDWQSMSWLELNYRY